jgi:hypothetical protein
MNRFIKSIFLLCGVSFALAALPVFAQQDANGITINKKPLKDFSESVKDKVEKKDVDLDKSFLVELETVLIKDGKFDSTKSKFIRSEGDAKMVEVARQAILAVGDSGWLGYLRNVEVEKVHIIFAQDETQTYAILKSEMPSVTKARTISSALNSLISIARTQKKEDDEGILLNGIKTSAQSKSFELNFTISKSIMQEMIWRKLRETESKNSESKILSNESVEIYSPFKQFVSLYKSKIKNEPINLDQPFKVVYEEILDEQRRRISAKFTEVEGNPDIVNVAKLGVEFTFNFNYLRFGGKRSFTTISQNEQKVIISFKVETESEQYANSFAANIKERESRFEISPARLDSESAFLLANLETSVNTEGKNVIYTYSFLKQYVQNIIRQELSAVKESK